MCPSSPPPPYPLPSALDVVNAARVADYLASQGTQALVVSHKPQARRQRPWELNGWRLRCCLM